MFRRRGFFAALTIVAAGASLGLTSSAEAAPHQAASAVPVGTIAVSTSGHACLTRSSAPTANVECGASLVQKWLRSRGQASVVRHTVLVPAGTVGGWPSSTTGGVCGFSGLAVRPTGMHHCDGITFVDPISDRDLIRTRLAAFTMLAHESAHGVQERRGKDPVAAYLVRDRAAMLPLEQQADCWAGAALNWAIRQNHFDAGQLPAARAFFRSIGHPGSGHGSGAAREAQLLQGYTGGAKACGLA